MIKSSFPLKIDYIPFYFTWVLLNGKHAFYNKKSTTTLDKKGNPS